DLCDHVSAHVRRAHRPAAAVRAVRAVFGGAGGAGIDRSGRAHPEAGARGAVPAQGATVAARARRAPLWSYAMSSSLTDQLFEQLQGAPLQQIAQQLGAGQTQTAGAISAA